MTGAVLDRSVGTAEYYLQHIAQYEREFKKWIGQAEKIVKRYKSEDRTDRDRDSTFNVLWSNVQMLKSSTFSRLPRPDVSRRFKDNDPIGRVAALIIERALQFEIDNYDDFRDAMSMAVFDRFLGGRGIAWVRYHPKITTQPAPQIDDEEATIDVLEFECAPTDYVHWKDFGHGVARTWSEVTIVWRIVYLTREALVERFGDIGETIPLDASPNDKNTRMESDFVGKQAAIYEIWDKALGKASWVSKTTRKLIDQRDDPLKLEEFFPCPRPLYATVTNDSLVPVPDYVIYQDQARLLNTLASRIDGLVKALQIRGVYDASEPTLARLFTEGSNTSLLPVKNWAAFAEKQGLSGALDIVDIAPIAAALNEAYQAFDQLKGQIYEISGISDILRGDTQSDETATAQELKGQYASLRLKQYQDDVAIFATHLMRLKAEIICNHFDDMTIARMASVDQLNPMDQQYVDQALQMMRSDPLRNFRIAIASDSMVYLNESQEKNDRMEFLNATSAFMEKLVGAAQTAPQILALGVEMLKFGVTGFRVGKTLEGVIDLYADELRQQAMQPPPPKPDPEQIKAQAQLSAIQAKGQVDQSLEQMRGQVQIQVEQAKGQVEAQVEAYKAQLAQQTAIAQQQAQAQQEALEAQQEQQTARYEAQLQAHGDQMRAAMEAHKDAIAQQMNLLIAHLNNARAIEVAEIAAGATLDAAQISSARQGSAN